MHTNDKPNPYRSSPRSRGLHWLAGLALAIGLTATAQAQPAPADAGPGVRQGPGAGPGPRGGDWPRLFTPEERDAWRQKIEAAPGEAERRQLRDERRAELQRRAKEKGVEPGPRAGGPGPRGDGPGPRAGGPGPRGAGANLFTPEERDAWRQKFAAAPGEAERRQLRDERRAALQRRAKEKGVEPGPRAGGPGPRGAGANLFTPEERDAWRQKFAAAPGEAERRQLRDERRAELQRRAKEKGVERGPRGDRGPGPGGGPR
jgi:truncated hemoglobin YjbI